MTRTMLDLCSGLGGASQSMLDHGWDVVRIEDNDALQFVPSTWIMDINDLNVENYDEIDKVDLVWASPPCLEFSQAFNAPAPKAQREGRNFSPDLSLVERCKTIIEDVNPTYWCIENVVGAIKPLQPVLGNPRMIVGPYVLWGNFPFFECNPGSFPTKAEKDVWSSDPLRANKKAKVPYELSDLLRQAIESQTSIFDY